MQEARQSTQIRIGMTAMHGAGCCQMLAGATTIALTITMMVMLSTTLMMFVFTTFV